MKQAFETVLAAHIAFGFTGLISFWFSAAARKGGSLHVKSGFVFAYAMFAVSISAFLLSILVFLNPLSIHPSQAPDVSIRFNAFLFYLGLFSFSSAWNGIRIVRAKTDLKNFAGKFDYAINILPGILGLGVAYLGWAPKDYLLIIFGGVFGPLETRNYLRHIRDLSSGKESYLSFHLQSMIGGGIGIHTAFFAGGAMTRYFPWLHELTGNLFWFAPAIVGSVAVPLALKRFVSQKSQLVTD